MECLTQNLQFFSHCIFNVYLSSNAGFHLLSSMHAKKHLKKIGLEGEDYYFLKRIGKGLLCTYAILGAMWLYNETSLPEWGKLKSRSKELLEQAHLYPGDEGSMKEFLTKIGTIRGPKGTVESGESGDKDAHKDQKELQGKKVDPEAQKMWLKMRNEVIAELREKGLDVE